MKGLILRTKKGWVNKQGVTLVELMVAIAILSIITLPFLSGYITAVKNNQSSIEKIDATAISLLLMENIKTSSGYTETTDFSTWAVPESLAANVPAGYLVKYRMKIEENGDFSEDIENQFTIPTGNLSFTIGETEAAFKDSSDSNLDTNLSLQSTIQYKLTVKEDNTYALTKIEDGVTDILFEKAGTLYGLGSTEVAIRIGRYTEDIENPFELHVDVDDTLGLSRKCKFYIVGNRNNNVVLRNDTETGFYIYDGIITGNEETNTLWKIEVEIYNQKGEKVNSLTSLIKK